MKKYDAILYYDQLVNEGAYDDRSYASPGSTMSNTKGFNVGINWDDPKLYAGHSFGNRLKSALDGMGSNYSNKVTDFGKWVTVEVTHHDRITGRSASKIFLVVFKQKGDGIVLSTHNRYRTISGVEQAASYIRSACGSLQGATQTKIG